LDFKNSPPQKRIALTSPFNCAGNTILNFIYGIITPYRIKTQ